MSSNSPADFRQDAHRINEMAFGWPSTLWDADAWLQFARLALGEKPRLLEHSLKVCGIAEKLTRRALVSGRIGDNENAKLLRVACAMHHIGEAHKFRVTGVAPVDGAMLLAQRGQKRLAGLVIHHCDPAGYIDSAGLAPFLTLFPSDLLQDFLLLCDLHVTSQGDHIHPMEHIEYLAKNRDNLEENHDAHALLASYVDRNFDDVVALVLDASRWSGDLLQF